MHVPGATSQVFTSQPVDVRAAVSGWTFTALQVRGTAPQPFSFETEEVKGNGYIHLGIARSQTSFEHFTSVCRTALALALISWSI